MRATETLKANFWLRLYDGGVTVSPWKPGPLYGEAAENAILGKAEVSIDAKVEECIDAQMRMAVAWEQPAFEMTRQERAQIATLGGALILGILESTDDREYETLREALA